MSPSGMFYGALQFVVLGFVMIFYGRWYRANAQKAWEDLPTSANRRERDRVSGKSYLTILVVVGTIMILLGLSVMYNIWQPQAK